MILFILVYFRCLYCLSGTRNRYYDVSYLVVDIAVSSKRIEERRSFGQPQRTLILPEKPEYI